MTVTRMLKPAVKLFPLSVVSIVLVAVLLGAALTWRGAERDLSLVPEMVASPVTLSTGAQLYVQKYELTVAEWNTCHDEGGCSLRLRARPDQDAGVTPATGLSYVDVTEYLNWINTATGGNFRLLIVTEN